MYFLANKKGFSHKAKLNEQNRENDRAPKIMKFFPEVWEYFWAYINFLDPWNRKLFKTKFPIVYGPNELVLGPVDFLPGQSILNDFFWPNESLKPSYFKPTKKVGPFWESWVFFGLKMCLKCLKKKSPLRPIYQTWSPSFSKFSQPIRPSGQTLKKINTQNHRIKPLI
jgi:hypothetical protein